MREAYAAVQDVYDLGLTAQAFVIAPRGVNGTGARQGDTIDPSTGTIRMIGHGLAADDLVEFVLIAAGALPTGGIANTPYSPLPLDFFRFRLALTMGGPAVTFSDEGAGGWAVQVDPERRLVRIALAVSADLDQDLIAHATPIERDPITHKFPDKLVGIAARCTARRATAGITFENVAFKAATERLFAEEKRDDEQRAAWRNGQPLLPTPLDQTPARGDDAARGRGRAPVGWGMGYL